MLPLYEAFRSIDVPEKIAAHIFDSNDQHLTQIKNLNKINIFIGANNSGKSLLLREILKSDSKKYYSDEKWHELKLLFHDTLFHLLSQVSEIHPSRNIIALLHSDGKIIFSFEPLYEIRDSLLDRVGDFQIDSIIEKLNSLKTVDLKLDRNASYRLLDNNHLIIHLNRTIENINRVNNIFKWLTKFQEEVPSLVDTLLKYKFSDNSNQLKKYYIPSIRTLRAFATQANIEAETKREYGFDEVVVISNGQKFPGQVFKLTNSKYSLKQQLISFEAFLSKEFFDSKKVSLTYSTEDNVLLIKIGEEYERPIHELGDGLHMIVILTYPFFFYSGGMIGIEEPELFMHPGLQKTFIKFLQENERTKEFQIFITTHSNHIIDSINNSNDISLFSIKKQLSESNTEIEKIAKFKIENLAFGNKNLLSLLGITSTSVYLSNCTIWVEGITDKLYISKFISEYFNSTDISSKYSHCKEYKEGINYSFALTGGDSIIHWDFSEESEYNDTLNNIIARKFCSKALIIVDNDFGKNKERKDRLKKILNERFLELKLPEIENYLSKETILNTILEYPSIEKNSEAIIINASKLTDTKKIKVGKLIDTQFLKGINSVKKFSSSKSIAGSIKATEKFIFCSKALPHINSNNLTPESKKLVETILDFIISHNNIN